MRHNPPNNPDALNQENAELRAQIQVYFLIMNQHIVAIQQRGRILGPNATAGSSAATYSTFFGAAPEHNAHASSSESPQADAPNPHSYI